MEEEFRRRFIVTVILTFRVLLLSPMIQQWLGFSLTFPGQMYVFWGLASSVVAIPVAAGVLAGYCIVLQTKCAALLMIASRWKPEVLMPPTA